MRRILEVDPFEVLVFVAFAGLSIWLLAFLIAKSGPNYLWTGTDGPFLGDQMQYLGWVQDASRHGLISDPFQTVPSTADYLHPGIFISGLLVRIGMSPAFAYLAWKPIAVFALFLAVRSYVHCLLPGRTHRRIALVLALFYISPVLAVSSHLSWLPPVDRYFLPSVSTEMWPGLYLWGYPFTAIAVAALVFALLAYGRDREVGRIRIWAPLSGMVCAWLQPWQGATLLGVLILAEGVQWLRHDRRTGLPAVSILAIGMPLAYYAFLGHLDPTWILSNRVNIVIVPALAIAVALVPLGLPATIAFRLRVRSFPQLAVRAWPIIALGLCWFISATGVGTYPLHTLQGMSIPLAVLAVVGVSSLSLRAPTWVLVSSCTVLLAVLLVPSMWQELSSARYVGDSNAFQKVPYFITSGEQSALTYLARDPIGGQVLSPEYLGQTVPAETGRRTWVGIFSWTPEFAIRTARANQLFSGRIPAAASVAMIRSSHARFLLADCDHPHDLSALISSILVSVRHFGCATVYQVSNH